MIMILSKFIIQERRVIMKVPRVTEHKTLMCIYCYKKGHIRADCWLGKKKQSDANVTELIGEDEKQCDILFVVDRSVGNKIDGLLTLDIHNTLIPIFS